MELVILTSNGLKPLLSALQRKSHFVIIGTGSSGIGKIRKIGVETKTATGVARQSL
jgi:siroheme synthase (precorrin-2 oxidase/ferrochelatase)